MDGTERRYSKQNVLGEERHIQCSLVCKFLRIIRMSRFDCYRLETTGKRGTRVEDQVPNTVAWKPDAQMFDRREG